jgi:hypothetical protein
MRLRTEDYGDLDDAGEADVRAAIARLDNGREARFAVLVVRDNYLMQTYANDDGSLDLEYREGGLSRHYFTPFPQAREAVLEAFLSYLRGDNQWRTAFEWKRRPEHDL